MAHVPPHSPQMPEVEPDDGAPLSHDPGTQSLADALHASFRVLGVIMLILVVVYPLTGVAFIRANEVGVKRVFGQITGTAEEGLAITWPFPIGKIERLPRSEREEVVEEFWMHESERDKLVPLAQRSTPSQGLRPLWDGALVTGDRNLLHIRLICVYEIRDAVRYVTNLANPARTVNCAVSRAAIRAAATETADGLMRSERLAEFTNNVHRLAQRDLDALEAGIEIKRVIQKEATWPLRALPEYLATTEAAQEKRQKIEAAEADAGNTLQEAAGRAARRLVGTLEQVRMGLAASAAERLELVRRIGEAAEQGDTALADQLRTRLDRLGECLIGQYMLVRAQQSAAEQAGDGTRAAALKRQADGLLARIDEVLLSNETTAEAHGILRDAATYASTTIKRLESWKNRFDALAEQCETPEATARQIEDIWLGVLRELMDSKTIAKHRLPGGGERWIFQIGEDPQVARQILSEKLRQAEEARRP